MCLSGGGIRSATFNLGILQGLTERGILPFIDYLSTVSGGGYIGTWLHGVIQRKCQGDPSKVASVICPSVEEKPPDDPTDDPVAFLRKYSNYLAPKLGLFSPDFWVIGVIWIRNLLLNQFVLLLFLLGTTAAGFFVLKVFAAAAYAPDRSSWEQLATSTLIGAAAPSPAGDRAAR